MNGSSNALWRLFERWLGVPPPLIGAAVDGAIFGALLAPVVVAEGEATGQGLLLALVLIPFVYASYRLRVHVRGVRDDRRERDGSAGKPPVNWEDQQ